MTSQRPSPSMPIRGKHQEHLNSGIQLFITAFYLSGRSGAKKARRRSEVILISWRGKTIPCSISDHPFCLIAFRLRLRQGGFVVCWFGTQPWYRHDSGQLSSCPRQPGKLRYAAYWYWLMEICQVCSKAVAGLWVTHSKLKPAGILSLEILRFFFGMFS